jgi:hypothetical protein
MKPIIIAFLSNKLTLRGTEIAMYDYADFNETMLGNKSIIVSRDYNRIKHESDVSAEAYAKFQNRFPMEYYQTPSDIDRIVEKHGVTHLYVIKGGERDGIVSTKCKNLIHCVFSTKEPHGDVYSAVSSDVNRLSGTNCPVVPHMIRNYETDGHMRNVWSIPPDAIVFGRYGGVETFDIPFVYEAIKQVLNVRPDVYFIFMNTNVFYNHPRILYLKGTANMEHKRLFINTCDAMLHARRYGETFGITCGEFAVALKPVITYSASKDRNHLAILGKKAVLYSDYASIYHILSTFTRDKYDMRDNGYLQYTPENIMRTFAEVYLQ